MTTASLALIIVAGILGQVAVVALLGLYRRKRQYRNSEHRTAAEQSPTLPRSGSDSGSPEDGGASGWDGFREFVVKRRVVEDGMASVCSFYLAPADGKPIPSFRPGQYLTFKLAIEDPASGRAKRAVRCYSLSDRPRQNQYRVSIKRIAPPPDKPDAPPGLSSNYFHDHVTEGSRLWIKAPAGHFYLVEDEPLPVVLVAGGIGITPMMSIINSLLEGGSSRPLWLYYGVRSGAEHVMKAHLQTLAESHRNFHLHVCYSRPGAEDVEGVDYQHRGHVDLSLLRTTLNLARYQFYVCGPRPMMESLVPALQEWGVPTGDIYYESFGPASLSRHREPERKPERSAQTISVTFSKSGKSIPWDATTPSLLAFAEANGIEIASGCRAGSCGSCQTSVASGEVEYSQQPDAEIEPGHCLLCISVPKNDLTLIA
jgi:ferredoxin-NADP reductase